MEKLLRDMLRLDIVVWITYHYTGTIIILKNVRQISVAGFSPLCAAYTSDTMYVILLLVREGYVDHWRRKKSVNFYSLTLYSMELEMNGVSGHDLAL